MKKTIAIIGSAAAMSFAGSGLAAAQSELPMPEAGSAAETTNEDGENTDEETPEEVSSIAQQLCGTISAYDFLGSAEGVVPGLSGTAEECEANAELAVEAASTGDIGGVLDILRGVDAGEDDDSDDDTGNGDDSGDGDDAEGTEDTGDNTVEEEAATGTA